MNQTDVMMNGHSFNIDSSVDEPAAEVIEQLKAKHRNIFSTEAMGRTFVFRNATYSELSYLQKTMASKERILESLTWITKLCCVYPEKAVVDSTLGDYPGLANAMGNLIVENSGMVQLEVKKY